MPLAAETCPESSTGPHLDRSAAGLAAATRQSHWASRARESAGSPAAVAYPLMHEMHLVLADSDPVVAEAVQFLPCRPPTELLGPDGTMRRRMVDTAAFGDAGPWQELIARALAAAPLYRPVPGDPVYYLRVDDQVVLVAEHDLSGALYDLVTAVLAIGEAPY
jgi:hypothetical protein